MMLLFWIVFWAVAGAVDPWSACGTLVLLWICGPRPMVGTTPRQGGLTMKQVLRELAARGLLISYTFGMHTGQRVRVWAEDGQPRSMTPGTAKAYLQWLEAQEWGFVS